MQEYKIIMSDTESGELNKTLNTFITKCMTDMKKYHRLN